MGKRFCKNQSSPVFSVIILYHRGRRHTAVKDNRTGWVAGLVRAAGNCVSHTQQESRVQRKTSASLLSLKMRFGRIMRNDKTSAPSTLCH